MNLVFARLDDNWLPLNPQWSFVRGAAPDVNNLPDINTDCNDFKNTGGVLDLGPGCTTQHPTVDEARPFRGISPNLFFLPCRYGEAAGMRADGVHGHVNWSVGSYTGHLNFTEYKPLLKFGDSDDNFALRTDGHGYVKGNLDPGNGPGLTVEFNHHEVLTRIDAEWVARFMRAAPRIAADDTSPISTDEDAIVVGLIGVDTKHTAHIELHPAYGIALREQSTPQTATWLIFARNWGSEGGCSNDQHNFDSNRLSFLLPNEFGASATVDSTSWFEKVGRADAWGAKVFGDGVLVTVDLAKPQVHGLAFGQITVCGGRCTDALPAQPAVSASTVSQLLQRNDSIVTRRARALDPTDSPGDFLVHDAQL